MTSGRRKVQWWSVYRKGSTDRHYSMYVKAGSIVPFGPKYNMLLKKVG